MGAEVTQEQNLLKFYQSEFVRMGIKPMQRGMALPHCVWMIDEMIRVATVSDDVAKINRWIGFVQGVLWKEGMYRIDELRQHVVDSKSGSMERQPLPDL